MKTNQLTLAVNSNTMESEIFADLALAFADRPLYRYGVSVDEQAADVLLKHYADKICRVHRWRYPEGRGHDGDRPPLRRGTLRPHRELGAAAISASMPIRRKRPRRWRRKSSPCCRRR